MPTINMPQVATINTNTNTANVSASSVSNIRINGFNSNVTRNGKSVNTTDRVLVYLHVCIVFPMLNPQTGEPITANGCPVEEVLQCETSICLNDLQGLNSSWVRIPAFKQSAERFKKFVNDSYVKNLQPGQVLQFDAEPFRIILRAIDNPNYVDPNGSTNTSSDDSYQLAIMKAIANIKQLLSPCSYVI